MKTVFLRALESVDKESALRAAILEPELAQGNERYEIDTTSFGLVPQSPFAYWVSDRLRELFKALTPFATDDRTARVGLQSNDDFRWLRSWWEPSPQRAGLAYLVPLAKGGANSPFYADLHTGIRWGADGKLIKAWKADQLEKGQITANNSKCWNEDYYFRAGLTWPHRSATFSAAALPAGCIFGQSGKTAFAPEPELQFLLGLFNSSLMTLLLRVQSDAVRIKFEVGLIQNTPLSPKVFADPRLALLGRSGWSLRRRLDTSIEVSHAFVLPSLLQVQGAALATRIVARRAWVRTTEDDLSAVQREIDVHCFNIYDVAQSDRQTVTRDAVDIESASDALAGTNTDMDSDEDDLSDEAGDSREIDPGSLVAELVSWTVGVAFGRFDVRFATGARPLPTEPEPFDPLPVCSPAMLTGNDGLPSANEPADYPIHFPENGVLVDDSGHARDLNVAVRQVFDEIFKERADAWWDEVGAILDPRDHEVRTWLKSVFFEYHLKRYSKSRRKAPIFWQLSVPSGGYSIWLYAHRMSRDSFFQVQNDVVLKLGHEERELAKFIESAGVNPAAAERKDIAARQGFVEELRGMLDEIKRVAPLWKPMLDDGIVLTMAPLWRLVPQHKAWQKELKNKWDELAAGKYDWAHLAMHLWPERVVPKCATDRSIAIAHGLEDVFWVGDDDGKWRPRSTPEHPLDQLVCERTSASVKSALKGLLEAPASGVTGARVRRRAEAFG